MDGPDGRAAVELTGTSLSSGRCPARHYMPASLELASRHEELVGTLISHRLPLTEISTAFDALREATAIKALVYPGSRSPGAPSSLHCTSATT